MTADGLTIGYWLGLTLGGLFVGALQRDGRHYFPANLLLGLAIGTPAIFYLTVLALVGGDLGRVVWLAATYHTARFLYPVQLAILLWALYLVVRVNLGRPGSRIDIFGRVRPPTATMVEDALIVVERGERHGLLTALTGKWLAEDLQLQRVMRLARGRLEREGWVAILWRLLAHRWRRRLGAEVALRRRRSGRPRGPGDAAGIPDGAEGTERGDER